MTVEEEINFQKELINERLRNIQIYRLAIKGLFGTSDDWKISQLIEIADKINDEKSSIEMSDKIIEGLKERE